MFSDAFKILCKEYVHGARKIMLNECYPRIFANENPPIRLQNSTPLAKELLFSKSGVLLESFQHDPDRKNSYFYNPFGDLIKIITSEATSHTVHTVVDLEYRSQNRLIREIQRLPGNEVHENLHTYRDGWHIVEMRSTVDSDVAHFYHKYDPRGRVIEYKGVRNGRELILWDRIEYDENGNKSREISLDDQGKIDGVYEHFFSKEGHEEGYSFLDPKTGKSYTKRFLLEFDEHGSWISKSVLLDGIPQRFHERKIEYF